MRSRVDPRGRPPRLRPFVAVLNKGIGGGRVLQDGLGPSALARFDRDVLAPASVKWLIVLEGIGHMPHHAAAGSIVAAIDELTNSA